MGKTSIEELKKKYDYNFRELSKKEKDFFIEKLNKDDEEWYEPYALVSTNDVYTDVLCQHDDAYSTSDELFVRIKPEWKFQ